MHQCLNMFINRTHEAPSQKRCVEYCFFSGPSEFNNC
jgi:hypothetical protein